MAFYDCAQLLQLGFGVSVIAVRLQCHHSYVKNKATFANMVFYGSPLARAVRYGHLWWTLRFIFFCMRGSADVS